MTKAKKKKLILPHRLRLNLRRMKMALDEAGVPSKLIVDRKKGWIGYTFAPKHLYKVNGIAQRLKLI